MSQHAETKGVWTRLQARAWPAGGPSPVGLLGIAGIVSLLLHLPFFSFPMTSDEGGYAYVAQRWYDGSGRLYDDIWVSRPQAIFIAYGSIFETIGGSTEAIRFGAWLFAAATLVFVWLFARAWAGRRAATVAVLIFAVLSGSPAIEGFTANAEVFMALPAAAAAWLLLSASRRGWNAYSLLAVGALASVAAQLKPSGVVMIPVALAFIWLVGLQGWRLALRRSIWVSLGAALLAAPALIHGYLIGWDSFVFASFTYRLEFQSSTTVPLSHHLRAIVDLLARIWPLLAMVAGVLTLRWRLLNGWWNAREWAGRVSEATRTGIVARPGVMPSYARGVDGDVLLRLWLLGSLAGIAMGGDWWFHYLVQIAAPFAIWFAPLLLDVGDRLTRFWRWWLVLTVTLVLFSPYTMLADGSAEDTAASLFNHPGYPAQSEVAEYLREHAPPDAKIFIGFDQAALYYLSDRQGSYRYMYDQELRAIPTANDDLVAMIRSPIRPTYVVGTRQRAPFDDRGRAFWDEVSEHYHLEAIVHGVPIWRVNVWMPFRPTEDLW